MIESLPVSMHIEQIDCLFQLTFSNNRGDVIGRMQFLNIDHAMFFVNPFAAEQIVVLNPFTLRKLLEGDSLVPYVFYDHSGRINRQATILKVVKTTKYKTVSAIQRFTGFPIQRIHETLSRFSKT